MYTFCRDRHTSYCSFTYFKGPASRIVVVQLRTLSCCSFGLGWILMGLLLSLAKKQMLFEFFQQSSHLCMLFCCHEACIANSAVHSINFYLKLIACFAFGHVQNGLNFWVTSNVFIWLAIIYNRLHDITLLKTVIHNCCTCLWETIRLNSIMRQTVLQEGDCYYLVMSFCILKTFSIPEDSYFKTSIQMSPNKVL